MAWIQQLGRGRARRGVVERCVVLLWMVCACSVSDRRPELIGEQVSPQEEPDDAGSDEAASTLDAEATRGVDAECGARRPPEPTERPKGPDFADVPDIYLGLTRVSLGASAAPRDRSGLDLDRTCTDVPDCPNSESDGSCAANTDRPAADAVGCRDNALASLLDVADRFGELGRRFGMGDNALNCGLRHGTFNVLARLRGYNGRADDPNVRVDWYSATAYSQPDAPNCDAEAEDDPTQHWDRNTPWAVEESGLNGRATASDGLLPDSRLSDVDGYVRGGRLVSRLPKNAVFRLNGGGSVFRAFELAAGEAYWQGRLSKGPEEQWRLSEGSIAGSTGKDTLLRSVRQTGFCGNGEEDLAYRIVLTFIDESADILGDGESDLSRACDALSFGIDFDATEVSPGVAKQFQPLVECCPPGKSIAQCTATCGDGLRSGDETCDTAIAAGQPGACPTQSDCPAADSCTSWVLRADGCATQCVPSDAVIGAKDGCCPEGGDATSDSDCAPLCGNGVLEPNETCDDPFGDCSECTTTNSCLVALSRGSRDRCDLRCELTVIQACTNGDGCCPSTCNSGNDADCSDSCGNGTLDRLETCETGGPQTCPANCDDGLPCTQDLVTGSPQNCNLSCLHTQITQAISGDACCPQGGTSNSDSDCLSICGNDTIEAGEGCDDGNDEAGDGCFDCAAEDTQQVCRMTLASTDACSECTCAKCPAQAIACYGAPNPDEMARCVGVAECQRATGCGNPVCWCGESTLFACLGGASDGPCKSELASAAGSDNLADISAAGEDPNTPLGRANSLRDCAATNCAAECGQ